MQSVFRCCEYILIIAYVIKIYLRVVGCVLDVVRRYERNDLRMMGCVLDVVRRCERNAKRYERRAKC